MRGRGFNPWAAAGAGLVGGGLGALFGDWENPADAASGSIDAIPGIMKPYYDPYINRGNQAGDDLMGRYGNMLNDPGALVNKIAGGYHQSPGFQFALKQALQGADHAAAAGGMAGSPQHEQQNMGIATGLADQDFNRWLSNALGMYGRGLSGEEGMYQTGFGASNELAQSLANSMLTKAQLQYAGQDAENQRQGNMWGSLGEGAGILAAFGGL